MIENAVNRVTYKGDGITTEFAIPFEFIDKEDIVVVVVDPDKNESVLQSDYFIDEEKKTVTYPGYPVGEEPPETERPAILQTGWSLVIYRDIEVTQESSLGDTWPFNVIEKALDKLTMICQDTLYSARRKLKLPESAGDDVDPTLPFPTPGSSIYWNEEGKKLVSGRNPDTAATEAEASAAAAKESETAAAQSQTRAAASEDAAKESEKSAGQFASKAEAIAENIGNPVVSVNSENGTVTVVKAKGEKYEFVPGINMLQREKYYEVGDIAYSKNLKSWQYLECISAGTTGQNEPDFSEINTGGVKNDGTVTWRVQEPFPINGGMNKKILNSVCIDGDIYIGDDTNSHSLYLRFRKDTSEANSIQMLAVPSEGSFQQRQAGIGFLRGPNNGEICAFLGVGKSPYNNGFKVYLNKIMFNGIDLHYIKSSYRNGTTCYQQDDTGIIFQCGSCLIQAGSDGAATKTLTLPHPMKDKNYVVFAGCAGNIGASLLYSGRALSTTQIEVTIFNFPENYNAGVNWYVFGMGS